MKMTASTVYLWASFLQTTFIKNAKLLYDLEQRKKIYIKDFLVSLKPCNNRRWKFTKRKDNKHKRITRKEK